MDKYDEKPMTEKGRRGSLSLQTKQVIIYKDRQSYHKLRIIRKSFINNLFSLCIRLS